MSNVRPESMARITNFELANAFIEEQVAAVRAQVGDKKVLLALSGGVDSSVVAALLIKAIGKQLVCVHVNHGLMRKDESEGVIKMFKDGLDANLIYTDSHCIWCPHCKIHTGHAVDGHGMGTQFFIDIVANTRIKFLQKRF